MRLCGRRGARFWQKASACSRIFLSPACGPSRTQKIVRWFKLPPCSARTHTGHHDSAFSSVRHRHARHGRFEHAYRQVPGAIRMTTSEALASFRTPRRATRAPATATKRCRERGYETAPRLTTVLRLCSCTSWSLYSVYIALALGICFDCLQAASASAAASSPGCCRTLQSG